MRFHAGDICWTMIRSAARECNATSHEWTAPEMGGMKKPFNAANTVANMTRKRSRDIKNRFPRPAVVVFPGGGMANFDSLLLSGAKISEPLECDDHWMMPSIADYVSMCVAEIGGSGFRPQLGGCRMSRKEVRHSIAAPTPVHARRADKGLDGVCRAF